MNRDEFMRFQAVKRPELISPDAICLHVMPRGLTVLFDLLEGLAFFTSFWRHVVHVSAKPFYSKALWFSVWAAKGKRLQEVSFLSVLRLEGRLCSTRLGRPAGAARLESMSTSGCSVADLVISAPAMVLRRRLEEASPGAASSAKQSEHRDI